MNRLNPKTLMGSLLAVLMIGSMFSLTGCQELSEQQKKVIAQQGGKGAAVIYIAKKKPTPELKALIVKVVGIIKDRASMVGEGQTYSQTLQPVIEEYIIGEFDQDTQPLIIVASSSLLSAIDVMFALNPDLSKTQDTVVEYVTLFCDGAIQGFALADNAPEVRAVRNSMESHEAVRARALKM